MIEKINEKVSVVTFFDRERKTALPVKLKWQGRIYRVSKLGFHHSVRLGRALHHIYSVLAGSMFFRLNFDTESLSWTLEEVSDGSSS